MLSGQNQPLSQLISDAPLCSENGAAAGRFADLRAAAAAQPAFLDLLRDDKVAALLKGVFDSSPYLTAMCLQHPERLARVLMEPPERHFERLTEGVRAAMDKAADMAAAKHALRIYKSEVALLAALADLGGVWPVMTVTRVLAECADAAVQSAVRYLFRQAVTAGRWDPGDTGSPETCSGYFVLGMGKLGAFELNYSSDIDLIVFFDRSKSRLAGDGDLQSFYVRLTRDLVLLLDDRTKDGYVFRTDLRLRPDAGATQVALSTAAAHGYYETVGQNWERAAMIKARAIAGDTDAGTEFLAELSPFVWRKYLDFAAIADIHAMKRQIHAHREIGQITLAGQNLKLGRGGIREIEFFAQTQQLIAGGRQPDLRVRATLDALAALETRGWVKAKVRSDLDAAYRFLRRLEHRLQMIADEQTHTMPDDAALLETVARFSGYATAAALSDALIDALETVERHYAGLFEDQPLLTGGAASMVFAGAKDDPATLTELARLGFSQPASVLALVRGWHHGRSRAVRSARSRELLTEVQPLLIATLADTADPDAAIAGFDRFLSELPAGVQLFSLLKAHPSLMRLIADIMGSTPRLARILSRRRRLLDAVLDPTAVASAVNGAEIDERLMDAFAAARRSGRGEAYQDILDAARITGGELSFLVGVGILTGTIAAAAAGVSYATIAERLVAALFGEACLELETEHGRVPGGQAVVVAMGKLGSREMTAASDLDLILIYDFASDASQSDGRKPLAPGHYFTRLTQRLINALSAPTPEGSLYEVDMRLRPSGQQGPVATKLSSFTSYQASEAWTWEHMALTRARVVAGSRDLSARVEAAIRGALVKERDRAKIAADVIDMRRRIEAEKGTKDIWDLKQVRGGLVDLEFIAQYLQLIFAHAHPAILNQNTLAALEAAAACGVLEASEHERLRAAGGLLLDLNQILKLSIEGKFVPAAAPQGLKSLLIKAARAASFDELEIKLQQALADIRGAFERLVA